MGEIALDLPPPGGKASGMTRTARTSWARAVLLRPLPLRAA
jgi:phage terminase large subunit-like protein